MGFTVYYEALSPVSASTEESIEELLDRLSEGRTWLSCEPIRFFQGSNPLQGGVKPNFSPHPEDVAAAAEENLPDGTLQDAIDVLCVVSERFDIEWSVGHDYSPGPIGFIRNGKADASLRNAMAEITEAIGQFDVQEAEPHPTPQRVEMATDPQDEDDEDDGPAILKFPGV